MQSSIERKFIIGTNTYNLLVPESKRDGTLEIIKLLRYEAIMTLRSNFSDFTSNRESNVPPSIKSYNNTELQTSLLTQLKNQQKDIRNIIEVDVYLGIDLDEASEYLDSLFPIQYRGDISTNILLFHRFEDWKRQTLETLFFENDDKSKLFQIYTAQIYSDIVSRSGIITESDYSISIQKMLGFLEKLESFVAV